MKNNIWNFDLILQRIENGETQKVIAKDLGVAIETLNRKLCGYRSALRNEKNLSTKELKRIANARHSLIVERKINTFQKQIINKETTNSSKIALLNKVLIENIKPFTNEEVIFENAKINKNGGLIHYLISDTHYIDESLTPMKDYIKVIVDNIKNDVKTYKPSKIHLAHLGDFIEGRIHRSQDFETKTTLMTQVLNVSELMICVIKELLLLNVKIDVSLISNGNHDELSLFQPRDERENITYMIDTILKTKFKNTKKIKINCAPRIYYKDKGMILMFTHLLTRQANPKNVIQFNGLVNDIRYKKHFDYSFSGHNHSSYLLDFKGKHYKHYVLPATKFYDNAWEQKTNFFSTKGMVKFKLNNDKSIDLKTWYF